MSKATIDRKEIIFNLLLNLVAMNRHKIENGEFTKKELNDFIDEQKKRYESMTDLQLKNIYMINF